MAELPNPIRLWRDVCTLIRCRAFDVLLAVRDRIETVWAKPGERDR